MDLFSLSTVAFGVPLVIGAFLSLVVAEEAFRRRAIPGSVALGIGMVLAALWNITAVFERAELPLDQRLLWTRLSYLAIPWIPPAWLMFVSRYMGKDRWIHRQSIIALLAIPLVTTLLALTFQYHDLIYTETALVVTGGRTVLQLEYGRWFWVFYAYTGAVLVTSIWVSLEAWLTTPGLLRRPPRLLTLAGALPLVFNLLYVLRLEVLPAHDYTPFALSVSGAVALFGLRRYKLLEIVPMARDKVFESMPDPVLILDGRRRIVELNPAFAALLPPGPLPAGNHVSALPTSLGGMLAPLEPGVHELLYTPEGRSELHLQVRVTQVLPDLGTAGGLLVMMRDVTAEHSYHKELLTLAMHDVLTGLPNRAMFTEFLHGELERARRLGKKVAVLFMDLDGFKKVNDTHGHALGDQLLRRVGDILRVSVRASDRVARFGGDEFLVLLPDLVDASVALAVARRIIASLEGIKEVEARPVGISASIGLALFPDHAGDTVTLVQLADKAMYSAKTAGGRRVSTFNPSSNDPSVTRG
jgi:diguanylate cyclase (GGDEF)-like protein